MDKETKILLSRNRFKQRAEILRSDIVPYNRLGQHFDKLSDRRLSVDVAGVIATYVMDGDEPLTAESAGNTTFYLYG